MPTGYTAKLNEGEQSFEDFVWGAARAMGAFVTMRDDPADAPIPDEFTPDTTFYDRRLAESRALLDEVRSMSVEEAEARAGVDYAEACEHATERATKDKAIRDRYERMLRRVRAWTPPTAEHIGFKKFMTEQLEESIRFDTGYAHPDPVRLTGAEWIEQHRAQAVKDLEYHTAERLKEIDRARGRTGWTKALRDSLAA